jgi:hypothetical protein
MLKNATRSLSRSDLSTTTSCLTTSAPRLFSTRRVSFFRSPVTPVSFSSAVLPVSSPSSSLISPRPLSPLLIPRVNMSSTAANDSNGAALVFDTYAKGDQTGSKPSTTVSGKNNLPPSLQRPVSLIHSHPRPIHYHPLPCVLTLSFLCLTSLSGRQEQHLLRV